jgi:hypothetical protein
VKNIQMKNLFFLFLSLALLSCSNNSKRNSTDTTSFILSSKQADVVAVFYTEDNDSLFLNPDWLAEVKSKMKAESKHYPNVMLFNGKENTPNVEVVGMQFPETYEDHLVCGYWVYPTGKTSFCYGRKEGNNWYKCEE